MTFQLDLNKYGPWALVTGASDGIGKAICEELAASGCHLILVARREDRLQALGDQLRRLHGVETQVIVADLANSVEVSALVERLEGKDIGLLVNAAGFGTSGRMTEIPIADELSMLDVNCRATLLLTHAFSRRLVRRGKGGIILFGSLVGFQGVPRAAHYAATKAYVQTLGEGLHRELKPHGVDVLVTAPGPVGSGFAVRARMTMGSAATPLEVARGTLRALGKKTTVRPGFLSKLLGYSLLPLPRAGRTFILQRIMAAMTKNLAILAFTLAGGMGLTYADEVAAPVIGLWVGEEPSEVIRIVHASDGSLEGFGAEGPGTTEADRGRKDVRNPNPTLQERSLLGARILWGFRPGNTEMTEWFGGKIYDPKDGKTYNCKVTLDGEELRIRGYVGIPLFGRTAVWKRLSQSGSSQ